MATPTRRTRYVPPVAALPFGTRRYDPATGNRVPGEFNQDGQPMGTPPAAQPSALTRLMGGNVAPNLARFQAQQASPGGASMRMPVPARDEFGRTTTAPQLTAPAAPVPTPTGAALPSNPDDRALLMATRAKDAAARAPEPISIPGGLGGHAMRPGEKPGGSDSPEGQALTAAVNRANGAVPQLATNPDRARLDAEAARTGSVRYVPTGTPEAPAVVNNTGVVRNPPEAATASPMDMPGYYGAPPVAKPVVAPAATPSTPTPSATDPLATTPKIAAKTAVPAARGPATGAYQAGADLRSGLRDMGQSASSDLTQLGSAIGSAAAPAVNAARDTWNGLLGRTPSAPIPSAPALPSATPTSTPPSLTGGPAMPFKFNDPRFQMPSSVTPDAPNAPLLTGPLPRKKATPLDEPANQYN